MRDKVFIDTNIFIYSVLDDDKERIKRDKAINLLRELSEEDVFISTQVVNEFHSILLKYRIPEQDIFRKLNLLINNSIVRVITVDTIKKSWELKNRYGFSLWDSLIVASAVESDCFTLFTEDLQHNQLIESDLRIFNPFV